MLFKGSRYAKVPILELTDAEGRPIRYLGTRFIPATEATAGHRVNAGERLDHVAFRHFNDPERFWRICDANGAMRPEDLLVPGRVLGIPPSEE